jgi:hypothetical protein
MVVVTVVAAALRTRVLGESCQRLSFDDGGVLSWGRGNEIV